ncbi:MAG: GtrA family protein [Pseudomonadota bacterium]|nr:GtrA family protein [Pseudomonadota bacterium]|tara:strand:+ start:5884 stop:6276 length:393 start_codon:yes stop_codon:yes gene_type:complete
MSLAQLVEAGQARRFVFTGGLASILHWSVMAALMNAGVGAHLSTALGALAGAFLNYLLQFRFTYRARASHRRALPAYVLTCAVAWLLNSLLFLLFFGIGGGPVGSQILTTAGVAIANYLIYTQWVFHESR